MTARWMLYTLAFAYLAGPRARAEAADKPGSRSNAEGQSLAAELRSARPTENMEVTGLLRIRDADGRRIRIPFRYRFRSDDKSWQNIYQTETSGGAAQETVVVIHTEGRPNQYLLSRNDGTNTLGTALSGDMAMIPFGHSDFWIADLGMEFLHWPEQRLVEEARIKMRKGRPCKVLESTNPRPGAAGYIRVRSWIDAEKKQPILAEAYGPDNKLVKEFEIGSVTKVNGQWELKNMEMRNARTDTQTVLEFKYERNAPE
jgi:Outer membrane lipoprotein-sorting protein